MKFSLHQSVQANKILNRLGVKTKSSISHGTSSDETAKHAETKADIVRLNQLGDAGEMVLSTDNLVKKYSQRTVANHVSIEVHQGEIVGLLGPNGAGKTTTFYMTTGLVTPNEGHVYLNDVDITKLPVYKRAKLGIGYLPQEASVFRKLTVENSRNSLKGGRLFRGRRQMP